jgi:uncharacterized membrane protein
MFIGISLRLSNLDQKFPWMDECITQVRISDYSSFPLSELSSNSVKSISVGTLKEIIEEKPTRDLAFLLDEISGAPEHPPLYYLLSAKLASLFGNKIEVLRGLSASISLLTFPCMYWLCYELFGSSIYGAIGVGIASVSPIYILYAQEAREYSLWIVAGMFSGATLLSALRKNQRSYWLLYSFSLVIGIYSNLFFWTNIAAQLIYVSFIYCCQHQVSKSHIRSCITTFIISILSFLPWVFIALQKKSNLYNRTQWLGSDTGVVDVFKRIIGGVIRAFFDIGFDNTASLAFNLRSLLSIYIPFLIVTFFIFCSLFYVLRKSDASIATYILSLILLPIIVIATGEIITGKIWSYSRYLMTMYLGLQLASVYFIGSQILHSKQSFRWFSSLLTLLIITGSLISCSLAANEKFWWNKGSTHELARMADYINRKPGLVLTDIDFLPPVLPLAYQLNSANMIQFSQQFEEGIRLKKPRNTYYFGYSDSSYTVDNPKLLLKLLVTIPASNLSLYEVKQ